MRLCIQPTIPPEENAVFAHAEFAHRFANLVSVIAREKDDPLFGERPKNQWAADKRAKELKNFAAQAACPRSMRFFVLLAACTAMPSSSLR